MAFYGHQKCRDVILFCKIIKIFLDNLKFML